MGSVGLLSHTGVQATVKVVFELELVETSSCSQDRKIRI